MFKYNAGAFITTRWSLDGDEQLALSYSNNLIAKAVLHPFPPRKPQVQTSHLRSAISYIFDEFHVFLENPVLVKNDKFEVFI
jgi:hypothetical protein